MKNDNNPQPMEWWICRHRILSLVFSGSSGSWSDKSIRDGAGTPCRLSLAFVAILSCSRHTVSCLKTNVLGDCSLHSLLPTRLPMHYDGICLGCWANDMGAIATDHVFFHA